MPVSTTRTDADASICAPIKQGFCIKVIGVGGAGCNALEHLSRDSLDGVAYAVMNTDAPVLARSALETRLILGAKSTRGLGAGGDPERGRAAAEEEKEQIHTLCEGADVVFVVAGLGGGTGTGAGPVVARIARESGALVLAIVFLPFECEGTRRQEVAQSGLRVLQEAADGVICLPNQKLFKFIDEKTSLVEAFSITNGFVAQGIRGIWRLLSRPGLINVDFADLCSLTQGKHSEGALATAEARGEHRAKDVVEKLLAHPLLDGGQSLAEASGVLITIAGGPDLTMLEVNRVMEQLQRQAEQAHIIMGAAIDPGLEDRMMVTLIASRRAPVVEKIQEPPRRNGTSPSFTSPRPDFDIHFVDPSSTSRRTVRFVPPAPETTLENTERLLAQQNGNGSRQRKGSVRMRQGQLPLEIISKGRFEKSEPTIHHGQDLDVPTYIRRGIALN